MFSINTENTRATNFAELAKAPATNRSDESPFESHLTESETPAPERHDSRNAASTEGVRRPDDRAEAKSAREDTVEDPLAAEHDASTEVEDSEQSESDQESNLSSKEDESENSLGTEGDVEEELSTAAIEVVLAQEDEETSAKSAGSDATVRTDVNATSEDAAISTDPFGLDASQEADGSVGQAKGELSEIQLRQVRPADTNAESENSASPSNHLLQVADDAIAEIDTPEADADSKPATSNTGKHAVRVASINAPDLSVASSEATKITELLEEIDSETGTRDREAKSELPDRRPSSTLSPTNSVENSPIQRFAEHLVPRGSEQVERPVEVTGPQQARFVERVSKAFEAAVARGTTVRLRLSPPELGSIRLDLSVRNGALSARVEAESPSARAALLDNLPALRERLSEQGLRLEQFDVELAERHTSGQAENPYEESMHDQSSTESDGPTGEKQLVDEGAGQVVHQLWQPGDDQIDVVI